MKKEAIGQAYEFGVEVGHKVHQMADHLNKFVSTIRKM
jgi:hypothetical protein